MTPKERPSHFGLAFLFTLLLNPFVIDCQVHEPSEFLQSFLSRPWLLPNTSSHTDHERHRHHHPKPQIDDDDVLTMSLYVDNWSQFSLVYSAHALTSGVLDMAFPPRDLQAKRRGGLVLKTATTTTTNKTGSSPSVASGMVGWTLVSPADGAKAGRISVAWKVGEAGEEENSLAMAIGDLVPQFDRMWSPTKSEKMQIAVTTTTTADLAFVTVADDKVTVAANLSRQQNDGKNKYILQLSVIPQKVDVWGWVKYFGEEEKTAEAMTTVNGDRATSSSWWKRSQKDEPARSLEGESVPRKTSGKTNDVFADDLAKKKDGGGGGGFPLVGLVQQDSSSSSSGGSSGGISRRSHMTNSAGGVESFGPVALGTSVSLLLLLLMASLAL